jgi:hypothetical protein
MNGYVICDLDGCLSDDRWRRVVLPDNPGNAASYDKYHSLCNDDEVVAGVLNDLMYDLYDEDDDQVALLLIVTARPDRHSYREITERWLDTHLYGTEYELLMRPSESTLPSPVTKMHLLNDYFAGEHGDPVEGWNRVISAFDDRTDVLNAYPIEEERKQLRFLTSPIATQEEDPSVPDILEAMAATFRERNAVYGSNYLRVAPIMKALWPEGVPSALVTTDRWHLFELIVVKLTRFAISGLAHKDSIHDAAVYAAMIEADLGRRM